jgi:hypothetical protein
LTARNPNDAEPLPISATGKNTTDVYCTNEFTEDNEDANPAAS